MTQYYKDDNDFTLYCGSCDEVMNNLGKEMVDLVFADPPYFLSSGRTVRGNDNEKTIYKGEWDETKNLEDINAFNRRWLTACRNVMKDDATIFATGTYHNIFSIASCMMELGYKILNIIVWQKTDAKPTLSRNYFNFTTEYIVWARKNPKAHHYFNCELMEQINGGARMSDVWRIPFLSSWELKCGKHPTQKPLRLLYRILLAASKTGDLVLDPFAGSCTTGIAAKLLNRRFIGIDQCREYLDYGLRRKQEIDNRETASLYLHKMSENNEELMVMVNHAKSQSRQRMIETGICYLRAGDSKGSLLITPGFERLQYVLLHTNGDKNTMYRLKTKGHFQIWTRETLESYGFQPTHAPYYIVLLCDNTKKIPIKNNINLKEYGNTYRAKIRPLSDFLGIK